MGKKSTIKPTKKVKMPKAYSAKNSTLKSRQAKQRKR